MDMSKDLVAASATPLVLAILAEGDSYGYAIIKRVAELSGGHLQWTDGMLYPVLHRLERQGHVAAKWSASENGRKRKYYRITKTGRVQLAAQRQQWQAVDGTLRGIWMQVCPLACVRYITTACRASRLAALLIAHLCPINSLFAPCDPGAAPGIR